MNELNWWDCPIKINNWNNKIDYVMFIDENGSAGTVNCLKKKICEGKNISDDEKYFTVTGVIFEKGNYAKMRDSVKELKLKYWNDGYYYDTKLKCKKYVCFHSRDIRMHTGAFNEKLINYDAFMNDLSDLLANIECKIISISINLEKYINKKITIPIYEKAFDLLLERYIYATKNNKKGIIILESRGKKEDKNLLKHIVDVINKNGQEHITSNELKKKILGVYFNPKWYNGYSSTYSGLEIADLFSYPIYQYLKYNKENLPFKTIERKINCYPNYKNKGVKIYP